MPPGPQPTQDADRLIYAGLLGLAAAGVIQLSDKSDLDWPLFIEVCAFALAMPLLAVALISDYAKKAGTRVPRWREALGPLGALAAVVGIGALFFHFGPVPGGVFAAGAVLGVVLVRRL